MAEQKIITKRGTNIYQFSSVNPSDNSNWRYATPTSTNKQSEKTAFAKSVSAAIKITNNKGNITNGALLYYSPKSMVPKNTSPKWNFNILTEQNVQGVSKQSFRFYKNKWQNEKIHIVLIIIYFLLMSKQRIIIKSKRIRQYNY